MVDRELTERAMRLIRDFDRKSEVNVEIDSHAVASLTALLESVAVYDEMDNDTVEELFGADDPVDAGVTALEILANHNVVDAIPGIIDFIRLQISEGTDDDYLFDDIPDALDSFGEGGVVSLLEHAVSSGLNERARSVLIQSVKRWGDRQEAVPNSVKTLISHGLEHAANHPIRVNTELMMLVLDWELEGFGESIERAFSLDRIDCGMAGGWEDVRQMLHVEGLGLSMPEWPFDSLDDFRTSIGVGIFSKKPIFFDDEIQEQAASKYMENAVREFTLSDEGRSFEGGYVSSFLDIGLTYFGVTVDAMTVGDVREILLEVYPSKVALKAEECTASISELCAFWHYVDRMHRLEFAKEIEKEIRGMLAEFRSEMANPANFGMAKTLFMAGAAEGYDMMNVEDNRKFMAEYNSRSTAFRPSGLGHQEAISRMDQSDANSISGMSLKMRKKLLDKKKRK